MLGMNPVSLPPASATQGEVNADWVAVWFSAWNSKITMSPMLASRVSGVYTLVEPPTTTVCVAAAATVEAAATELMVVVAALSPGFTQIKMTSVVSVDSMLEIWLLSFPELLLSLLLSLDFFEPFVLSTCVNSDAAPTTKSFRAPRAALRKSVSKVPAKANCSVHKAASAVICMMKDFCYIRRIERRRLMKASKLSKLL